MKAQASFPRCKRSLSFQLPFLPREGDYWNIGDFSGHFPGFSGLAYSCNSAFLVKIDFLFDASSELITI
jgi:hypothetical protein